MASFDSTRIPKPKNWQDFERQCRVLFSCILNDPNLQLFGRAGQAQAGVDMLGRRASNNNLVGVQCKNRLGSSVSEAELREEASRALGIVPPLDEFIVVTTAPDDASIQQSALLLEHEVRTQGRQIKIAVWGWETIEQQVSVHPEALAAFHPDISPFSRQLLNNSERALAAMDTTHQTLSRIEGLIRLNLKRDGGFFAKGQARISLDRPRIEAYIQIPSLKVSGIVSLLVDTGADMTVLMPTDAERLRVSLSDCTSIQRVLGLFGESEIGLLAASLTFQGGDALYGYRTMIGIFGPGRGDVLFNPSILGRDILRHWDMRINLRDGALEFTALEFDHKANLGASLP